MSFTLYKKSISATGTTTENEPIIKSDGASSNVMQWLSNNEASNITISEDGSNNLDLDVSSGTVTAAALDGTLGATTPASVVATTVATSNTVASPVTLSRTGSAVNASITYTTTGGSIYAGYGSAGLFAVNDSIDLTSTPAFTVNAATGATTTAGLATFAGNALISTASSPKLDVTSTGATVTNQVQADDASGYLGTSTNHPLSLRTNNAVRVTIPATGGIYEVNGVLKENLLTNSGFDVWSNSTLENVTGTNLITGWTNGSGGDAYGTFTSSGANVTSAISDGSAGRQARSDYFTTATGKLYKMVVTLTLNSGTAPILYIEEGDGSGYISGFGSKALVAGANTFVYEESSGGSSARFIMYNAAAASNWSCTFTHYEVTPGIVTGTAGPDGWLKSTSLDIWRQHNDGGTNTKDGSFYALKSTTAGTVQYIWGPGFYTKSEWIQRFAGRTLTLGCWAKTSAANHCRLALGDGVVTYSSYHTGGGAWEWLEVTKSISASAGEFYWEIFFNVTATDAYISQPMLVFGSAIGSGNYSRPSGEIVNCEKEIAIINNESPVAATDKIRNLESDSSGKIPKGAKAITVRGYIQSSAVSSGKGVHFGPDSTESYNFTQQPVVVNFYDQASGVINCDSNGDIYQLTSFTGSTASAHYMAAYQVQLR